MKRSEEIHSNAVDCYMALNNILPSVLDTIKDFDVMPQFKSLLEAYTKAVDLDCLCIGSDIFASTTVEHGPIITTSYSRLIVLLCGEALEAIVSLVSKIPVPFHKYDPEVSEQDLKRIAKLSRAKVSAAAATVIDRETLERFHHRSIVEYELYMKNHPHETDSMFADPITGTSIANFDDLLEETIAVLESGVPVLEAYPLLRQIEDKRVQVFGPSKWPGILFRIDGNGGYELATSQPHLDQYYNGRFCESDVTPEENEDLKEHFLRVLRSWLRESLRISKNNVPSIVTDSNVAKSAIVLTERDRELWQAMFELGLSSINPRSREIILRKAGWTSEGKRAFEKLIAIGYVKSQMGVGYYLTELGTTEATKEFTKART